VVALQERERDHERRLANLNELIQERNQELQTLRTELSESRSELGTLQHTSHEKLTAALDLIERMRERLPEGDELHSVVVPENIPSCDIDGLHKEIESLQSALQTQRDAAREQGLTLEGANDTLSRYRQTTEELQSDLVKLRTTHREEQCEWTSREESMRHEFDNEKSALHIRISQLEMEVQKLKENQQRTPTRSTDVEGAIAAQTELIEQRSLVEQLRTELEIMESRHRDANERLSQAEKEKQELRAELDAARTSLEQSLARGRRIFRPTISDQQSLYQVCTPHPLPIETQRSLRCPESRLISHPWNK